MSFGLQRMGDRLRLVADRLRGLRWAAQARVSARGTPRVGPRCVLRVEPGATLRLGANCRFDRDVEIVVYSGATLELGNDVYVGHGSTIASAREIRIAADTLVGDLVSIRDANHRRVPGRPLRDSGIESRPVAIGRNCWIGSKVTITAGARLGDDVTVGANAVVAGAFGDGLVIGGVPARAIVREEAPA